VKEEIWVVSSRSISAQSNLFYYCFILIRIKKPHGAKAIQTIIDWRVADELANLHVRYVVPAGKACNIVCMYGRSL